MKLIRQGATDTFLLEDDRGVKVEINKGDNIAIQVVADIVATALTFTIQGSIDGNHFDDMTDYTFTAIDLSSKSATIVLPNYALLYLAVKLTTLTGITSSQVNVFSRIS